MVIIKILRKMMVAYWKLPTILWRLEARLRGVNCHSSVLFIGRPVLGRCEGSQIILEENVRIHSLFKANPLGCFQPSILRTLTSEAYLKLGRNVGISGSVIAAGKSIEIGEGTILGAGAMILDNDFHAPSEEWEWRVEYLTNAKPIMIGKGVFIGTRAIILKGVTIGDRAVIGAGAVVTTDVPAGAIAAGNPARIIRPGPALSNP
jgi:acetyltransferase-like isoleucine patch superfamily enzyme